MSTKIHDVLFPFYHSMPLKMSTKIHDVLFPFYLCMPLKMSTKIHDVLFPFYHCMPLKMSTKIHDVLFPFYHCMPLKMSTKIHDVLFPFYHCMPLKMSTKIHDVLFPFYHCIWPNAGILLSGTLGTNLSEILIETGIFSFKEMDLKVLYVKLWPFCLGLNMLTHLPWTKMANYFTDDVFKCNFFNRKFCILIKISVKFAPRGQLTISEHWFR